VVALASCARGGKDTAASPDQRPFGAFAAQRIVVTPTGLVRADADGWIQAMGGGRTASRHLDSTIAFAFEERGLAQRWVMPAGLVRTYDRNRSYATDPYQLSIEQLRASSFKTASRLAEPLSSQLRTMIGLESDARFVLMPVELRFEKTAAGTRGILRIAFVDPRLSEARFVGDVKGDFAASAAPAFASVAKHLVDLFAAP